MPPWLIAALVMSSPECPTAPLRLDWVRAAGAESCAAGDAIEALVADRLGCRPFGAAPAARFEVVLAPSEAGFVARLTRFDARDGVLASSELRSDGEPCAVLGEAVALMIVLTAEALPGAGPVTNTSSSAGVPPPAAAPRPRIILVPSSTPTPSAPPPAWPSGRVTVAATANVGTMPAVSAGARVGVAWALGPRWELGAGLSLFPNQRSQEFGFSLSAGWLMGCVRVQPGAAVALGGCLRVHAGGLVALVYPGTTQSLRPGGYGWAAASAAGFAEVRVWGPVAVRAEVEPLVSLVQRRFTVDPGGEEVFGEAPVALQASLGLAVHFR